MVKLAVILLAAGASRRLGQSKQLVRLAGQTLLSRAVEAGLGAHVGEVFVVIGAYAAEMREELRGLPVRLVENKVWKEGIASSIRAGVEAALGVLAELDGILIMSCDQPHVAARKLHALAWGFEGHGGGRIAASEYAGVVGIPAVFPREKFAALMALTGDEGARKLIRSAGAEIVRVPMPDGEVDIDFPCDLDGLGLP